MDEKTHKRTCNGFMTYNDNDNDFTSISSQNSTVCSVDFIIKILPK